MGKKNKYKSQPEGGSAQPPSNRSRDSGVSIGAQHPPGPLQQEEPRRPDQPSTSGVVQQQRAQQQQYQQPRSQSQQGKKGPQQHQKEQPAQKQQQEGEWQQRPQQQKQKQGEWQQRPQQQQQKQGESKQRPGQQRPQQQKRQDQHGDGPRQQGEQQLRQQQQQGPRPYGGSQQQGQHRPVQQQRWPKSSGQTSGAAGGGSAVQMMVETNYLELNMDKMPHIAYHYDVTMDPEKPKKFIRRAFEQFNHQYFPKNCLAFDNKKSCYTASKLEFPGKEFCGKVEVSDTNDRKMTFSITIKSTANAEIDLDSLRNYENLRVFDKPQRALQCLEVALSSPCHERGVRAGRSFFVKPNQPMNLCDGYELWLGLYQACILGQRPLINVDISHKSFPSASTLVDYLGQAIRSGSRDRHAQINLNNKLDPQVQRNARSFLRGMNIIYEPPAKMGALPRTYKVLDISEESADKIMFELEGTGRISVADYFQMRGVTLKYPKLQCIQAGSREKPISLPMEFCKIPEGQAINRKDGPKVVREIIRFAATSTHERKKKIMGLLRYFNHAMSPIIRSFGLTLGEDFIKVPFRVLMPPSLEYYNGMKVMCQKGSWRVSDGACFLKSGQKEYKWAILANDKSMVRFDQLDKFATQLVGLAGKRNIRLNPKPDIKYFGNIDTMLSNMKGYDLIFVLIPRFKTTYAEIKQSAELKLGVLTQCIKEETLLKSVEVPNKLTQLIGNLLLKCNAKLNGTNHKIAEPGTASAFKDVMFVGADVTHPSPDQVRIPSVVGVVASHDPFGCCYNMQYRLQESGKEDIQDMNSILEYHLKTYFKYQGNYPKHIIYYRDGVSEGQFPIIRNEEIRGMRAAISRLKIKDLKITCVVVVKRHHTRFFPLQPTNDKFNNVAPGTIVDEVITHPREKQFFLVSHESIQGTAKPTYYHVIEDDAEMNMELLQNITYHLCHLFPRCNRSVSYPAPAYLAHLVASRGRVYLEGAKVFHNLDQEYKKRLVRPEFMLSNPMYFV